MIACRCAGQGAKRSSVELERELEVAVRALAVVLLAAWALLLLQCMHSTGLQLCLSGMLLLANLMTLSSPFCRLHKLFCCENCPIADFSRRTGRVCARAGPSGTQARASEVRAVSGGRCAARAVKHASRMQSDPLAYGRIAVVCSVPVLKAQHKHAYALTACSISRKLSTEATLGIGRWVLLT